MTIRKEHLIAATPRKRVRPRGRRRTLLATFLLVSATTLHAQDAVVDVAVSISERTSIVRVGEIASLRLDVRNLSANPAPFLSLHGSFAPAIGPGSVMILSAKGERSECRVDADYFTCAAQDFDGGSRDSIVVTFTPFAAGAQTFTASVSGTANDSNPSNNRISETFEVGASSAIADLTLSVTAPPAAIAGSRIRQTYIIENRGPARAEGVVLSILTLYPGFGQLPSGCLSSGTIVSCVLPPLAANSTTTFDFDFVAASAALPLETKATAIPLGASDPTPATANARTIIAAPGGSGYEKVLLPLTPDAVNGTPGANGSRWKATLSLLNQSMTPVTILGYDQGCRVGVCPTMPTPPRITFTPLMGDMQHEVSGMFLFVDSGRSRDVEIQLRVRDLSRQSESWGTSIPVIHEKDAFRGMRNILQVPTDDVHRTRLRLYDFDAREGAAFNVRLYAIHDDVEVIDAGRIPDPQIGGTLLETRLAKTGGATTFHPGYTEIDLSQIEQRPQTSRFRVEIEPVQSDLRWWGFVTATNNETQHVTVLVPR